MAMTRSGLAIPTLKTERGGKMVTFAREHPGLVRITHWLNAISLTVMTMSGLQIFMAFPSFGPKVPQRDLVHVPEVIRLGGWLGGALQWHFTFAWIFTLCGVAYLAYLIGSGHWRQVVFQPRDIRGILPMVRHYLLFQSRPEQTEPYNALQKLAYTSTILFGIGAVGTGLLLYQPRQFSGAIEILGGFGLIRILHFGTMLGFLAFIPGHLIMVALHGWNNFYSMLTGWKRGPDYLSDASLEPRRKK